MKMRAEINLNALTSNLNGIRSLCPGKEVLAVVKANAYGHGIEIVTAHLYKQGVKNFAVSNVFEAKQIHSIINGGDILILGRTDESFIDEIIENNYLQAIVSVEHGRQMSALSVKKGNGKIRCHIKVDTGMTRLGITAIDELNELMQLPGLKPEALFTHLSSADSLEPADMEYTINQQSKFTKFASRYNLKCHSQNTGGVMYHGGFGGDVVRAGIALYGYRPNTAIQSPIELKSVMSLKSEVIQIREVGAGVPVSYGRSYVTDLPQRLAVVAVGYADGYSRMHSGRGKVLINGKFAPIRGRVCMEYTVVDITNIGGVNIGDEVVVYSDSELYGEIGIEHIADMLGTIPYEVTCAVAGRVLRVPKIPH
ncbi:MAG: alanine racemase [Oscillospiraceae bacterium]|nr:alanine racemase [Oscillospiraceae bacterium]